LKGRVGYLLLVALSRDDLLATLCVAPHCVRAAHAMHAPSAPSAAAILRVDRGRIRRGTRLAVEAAEDGDSGCVVLENMGLAPATRWSS